MRSSPSNERARRVAWSILVALGAIDSGSNPGGPIVFTVQNHTFFFLLQIFVGKVY